MKTRHGLPTKSGIKTLLSNHRLSCSLDWYPLGPGGDIRGRLVFGTSHDKLVKGRIESLAADLREAGFTVTTNFPELIGFNASVVIEPKVKENTK